MRKIVLVVITFLFFQISITVHAQIKPTYGSQECEGKYFNYTDGSEYEKNLKTVLNNLATKAASLRFDSSTVGKGSNQVYGLFQCRFDVSLDFCNRCIKQASNEVEGECLDNNDESTLWYIECMVRFSNRNIFSTQETYPAFQRTSVEEVENPEEFGLRLKTTLTELIKNASLASPPFATGETDSTSLGRLYSYAQCTPDIDIDECNACLIVALSDITDCCSDYQGAMIFLPSCQLRYDTAGPFLGNLPLSSPPPPPIIKQDSNQIPLNKVVIAIGACVFVGLLVLSVVLWIHLRREKPEKEITITSGRIPPASPRGFYYGSAEFDEDCFGDAEFLQYDFVTLETATRGFSTGNMLGEGGFGIVYKGTLENGEQLAIKRLSDSSGQGTKEFMAEASLLAKLQHKNLVKIVGFCSEGEEKLLVYEFLSNSSLDSFLFDPRKQPLLDWVKRCKIIMGIARGLQYLHEDSRLTIIHRDLKPGNILLDKEMNPKIADFGLARLFGGTQKSGSTLQIVGTKGYMAPEYMMSGEYSDKTDVYSFGIVLLEIVSGQKNNVFVCSSQKEDISIYAWRLWNEERSIELTDPVLFKKCSSNEVRRCIQIVIELFS